MPINYHQSMIYSALSSHQTLVYLLVLFKNECLGGIHPVSFEYTSPCSACNLFIEKVHPSFRHLNFTPTLFFKKLSYRAHKRFRAADFVYRQFKNLSVGQMIIYCPVAACCYAKKILVKKRFYFLCQLSFAYAFFFHCV